MSEALLENRTDRSKRRRTLGGRHGGRHPISANVARLLARLPRYCLPVTVTDGQPATLGSVCGDCTVPPGVERFGQAGTIDDLHALHGNDVDAIVRAAQRHGGRRLSAAS